MSLWTVRGRGNGNFLFPVFFPDKVINRDRIVLASICEIARIPGEPNDLPWVGDAAMEVRNIVPRDTGEVYFRVEIGWDSPLDFRISIAVFD
jgi:hypothetical protein